MYNIEQRQSANLQIAVIAIFIGLGSFFGWLALLAHMN